MRIVWGFLAGALAFSSQALIAIVPAAYAQESNVPRFLVDPFWPKPLPNRWVTGAVGGVCVDRQDHIFGVNRIDLTPMEQKVGKQTAPIVIEYDAEGDMVNGWGDPQLLPRTIYGCFVDSEDNIWIGGSGDGVRRNGRTTARPCCFRSDDEAFATIRMRNVANRAETGAQPFSMSPPTSPSMPPTATSTSRTVTATTAWWSSTPMASSCANGAIRARTGACSR